MSKRKMSYADSDRGSAGAAAATASQRQAEYVARQRSLNNQFARWVNQQQNARVDFPWTAGVAAYLGYAEELLQEFPDILQPDVVPPKRLQFSAAVSATPPTTPWGQQLLPGPAAATPAAQKPFTLHAGATPAPKGGLSYLATPGGNATPGGGPGATPPSKPQTFSFGVTSTSTSTPAQQDTPVQQQQQQQAGGPATAPFGSPLLQPSSPVPALAAAAAASSPPLISFGFSSPSSAAAASTPTTAAGTAASDASTPAAAAASTPAPTRFSFGIAAASAASPSSSAAPAAAGASENGPAAAPLFGAAPAAAGAAPSTTPAAASSPFTFGVSPSASVPAAAAAGSQGAAGSSSLSSPATTTAAAAAAAPLFGKLGAGAASSSQASPTTFTFGAAIAGAASPAAGGSAAPGLFSFAIPQQQQQPAAAGAAGGEGDDQDAAAAAAEAPADDAAAAQAEVQVDARWAILYNSKCKLWSLESGEGEGDKATWKSRGAGPLTLRRDTHGGGVYLMVQTDTGKTLATTTVGPSLRIVEAAGQPKRFSLRMMVVQPDGQVSRACMLALGTPQKVADLKQAVAEVAQAPGQGEAGQA